jgi:hypothetical protein
MNKRRFVVSFAEQDFSEIQPGLMVVGVRLDNSLEMLFGFRRPPLPEKRQTQIEVCHG